MFNIIQARRHYTKALVDGITYDDAHVQGETKEEPYICKIVEMFEAIGDVRDNNHLDCLVEKLHIIRLTLNVDQDVKSKSIPVCNYYCDTKMMCCLDSEVDSKLSNGVCEIRSKAPGPRFGCEGMSTGLCLGAHLGSVNLVTIWAVDCNGYACKSLEQKYRTIQRQMSEMKLLKISSKCSRNGENIASA
ncbi:hypothetical protein ACFX1X_005664 [Malus domestica]